MTPEEQTLALVPNTRDMARAGAVLAAEARTDLLALCALYDASRADDRLFQLIVALAETCVQHLALREEENLRLLLAEIADYTEQADRGEL
jgi:hypothetical protein